MTQRCPALGWMPSAFSARPALFLTTPVFTVTTGGPLPLSHWTTRTCAGEVRVLLLPTSVSGPDSMIPTKATVADARRCDALGDAGPAHDPPELAVGAPGPPQPVGMAISSAAATTARASGFAMSTSPGWRVAADWTSVVPAGFPDCQRLLRKIQVSRPRDQRQETGTAAR
jgi:hypothetical protein